MSGAVGDQLEGHGRLRGSGRDGRIKIGQEGYLIIREAVPPDRLAELRLMAEILVDRCKSRSEARRVPGGALRERGDIEAVLRAAIAGDGEAFGERIARLHPGPGERMTTVVLLSRIAAKVGLLHTSEVQRMGTEERHRALAGWREKDARR